ncbi:DUF2062 domain-containing protein [Pontibacter flavimaris]|uniref:DUF2062 domain-containing protein n=1 Tax=Pontibacter flavimaris TaxID=1797110 RepID=A0A1Q5PH93_9BACT|nr:DUF2062 domain-containing protein [Pontibacter flavimaris]OKL41578.1 hypothetical protein A3841_11085 [Pontibacter flavimaris]
MQQHPILLNLPLVATYSVISDFLRRKLVQPVSNLLRQGMTARSLSATVAAGSVIGVVPALGVATVLATAVAARFRLNIAATVLVSYLVQPLQLLLALPFIRLGISFFGLGELRLTLEEMQTMFQDDWLDAIGKLWMANLAGVAAWAILSIPVGVGLYFILQPVLQRVLPKPSPVVVEGEGVALEAEHSLP